GGAWYGSFFWYHNVERALGSGGLRSHPWWFYGPRLAIDLLPWSLLFPVAALSAWQHRRNRLDAEARFGLLWLVASVVILSFAGFKRADYLLPAYPGAALFLGFVVEGWVRARANDPRHTRSLRWAAGALATLLVACAAGWWTYEERLLPADEPAREYRQFA